MPCKITEIDWERHYRLLEDGILLFKENRARFHMQTVYNLTKSVSVEFILFGFANCLFVDQFKIAHIILSPDARIGDRLSQNEHYDNLIELSPNVI